MFQVMQGRLERKTPSPTMAFHMVRVKVQEIWPLTQAHLRICTTCILPLNSWLSPYSPKNSHAWLMLCIYRCLALSPSPNLSPSLSLSPSPNLSPSLSLSPSPSPNLSPSLSLSPSPSPSLSPSLSLSPSPSPSLSPSLSLSPSPSLFPSLS